MLFRGFATGFPWIGCVGSIEKILGQDPIVCARMIFQGFATGSIEKILGDPIFCARILFQGFATGSIEKILGDPIVHDRMLFRGFTTRGM